MPRRSPFRTAAARLAGFCLCLGLLGGCTVTDPVRNLANQAGNAGPPASDPGNTDPAKGGARIALGQPVWSSPLPPPGPIEVGRR